MVSTWIWSRATRGGVAGEGNPIPSLEAVQDEGEALERLEGLWLDGMVGEMGGSGNLHKADAPPRGVPEDNEILEQLSRV